VAEHAQDQDEDQGLLARWRQTEPLRLWLYGIAVPLLALLVGYGLLTHGLAGLWLAVLTAALLGGSVEGARQYVVSPATAAAAVEQTARAVDKYGAADLTATTRSMLIRYRIPS
jgi:hypothetical protein